ncbi:homodimeric glycerol 3-phosphate dehydrogenase (quinone) [Tepidamorphus gemmatus]|uniref:Glycerol-3-phosphate dehydrogenase n=1 Tax=Tepidamorphus gemmatus TaxID=747076 RepID=A0A4R3MDK4_9HYPH|nr:homodimeric glycerol 3-phosphate dehydrogenase (quinone) [Tepidamorphus gemmatus]
MGSAVADTPYDIAVIGGGINGCGIARDAAGRGLSVFLAEKGDLAGATSSASTKLIHGGLRYLEYFEFRLVRESLVEREVLLQAAPHIIWPLRFVLPHHAGLRPAWLIRLGLFLYDHLGGRRILPPARTLDLAASPAGQPLKPHFRRGFEYSDCWVEDSRLVVLNAVDAAERGAVIRTRCEVMRAARDGQTWLIDLQDHLTGTTDRIRARALVNASGPWVAIVGQQRLAARPDARVRLVKGSHIITRRLFDHDRAYIFQNADGRIVFAIPYENDFTLIGTTDLDYAGDPGAARITPEETRYLCAAASEYFRDPVRESDVIASFAGVRPLYDDGASAAQAATRDYVLKLDGADRARPPLLTVYGGKITTYRRLAEAALAKLGGWFPKMGGSWTHDATLPGGDFPVDGFEAEVAALRRRCPSCSGEQARRLVRAYGTRAASIVEGVREPADWGRDFGAGLTEREVRYLIAREWAMTAEDVLWRRSKLALRIDAEGVAELEAFMGANVPRAAATAA